MGQPGSGSSIVRVGVIGLGRPWAERFRASLSRPGGRARVVAVSDPVTHRAEAEADRLGCDAVEGLGTLLDRPDVEAVMLLDASWYGPWPLLAALDRGKPAFSALGHRATLDAMASRPDGRRRDDPPTMLDLARRFAPETLRLLELLATGLGPARRVSARARASASPADAADAAVELVDWCLALFRADPIDARLVSRADRDGLGLRVVDLDFPGGGTARLSLRTGPSAGDEGRARLLVEAERGRARVDPRGRLFRSDGGAEVEERAAAGPSADRVVDHFLRLARGEQSMAPGRDAMAGLDRASRVFDL